MVLFVLKEAADCFAVAGPNSPKIGESPPPLRLGKVLQGPTADEIGWERLLGKVVVLEFWDTRCVPCVAAIPHWNQLATEFREKPVVFLSVSDENETVVSDFLRRKPIQGWVALDGPLATTQTAFGVEGIPHTVIVDAKGRIAAITHPSKLAANHLEEILASQPCSLPSPTFTSQAPPEEFVAVSKLASQQPPIAEMSIRGPFQQPNGPFNSIAWTQPGFRFEAKKAFLKDVVAGFFRVSPQVLIGEALLPKGLYDVVLSGPSKKAGDLHDHFVLAMKTSFEVIVRTNSRPWEVYSMTFGSETVTGRKLATKPGGGGGRPGGFSLKGGRMRTIAQMLESVLDRPVIDETQDTNRWAAELNWEMTAGERLLSQIAPKLDSELLASLDTVSFEKVSQSQLTPLTVEESVLLQQELKKPSDRRFQPDPVKVIEATRLQLGLDLRLVTRTQTVVHLETAN